MCATEMEAVQYEDDEHRRQYLFEQYIRVVLGVRQQQRVTRASQLHNLTIVYLCAAQPNARLSDVIVNVFWHNIQLNPNWNMRTASKTMKWMEKYCWNLLDFPWKNEFKTIKVGKWNLLHFV